MLMPPVLRLTFIALGTCAYTGLAILGWGGLLAVLLSSGIDSAGSGVVRALSRLLFRRRQCQSRHTRGAKQSVGYRRVCRHRISQRVAAGIHGSQRVVDDRWRGDSLARCRALRWRWCVANLASVCVRRTIQWPCRDPTGAYSGNQRNLRCYPSSKLPWSVHQLTGLEPGFSFGSWCASDAVAYSAASSAHQR